MLRDIRLYVSIFLFCLILTPQLLAADSIVPPFQCPAPNFDNQSGDLYNNCNDILSGERVFLPIDDLAISQIFNDDGLYSTNVFLLNTENNTISSQSSEQIAAGAPLNSGFQNLDFGRFVKQGIFLTQPNAAQGVVIGPNNNNFGNQCPNAGPGQKLVINFFRNSGQFDCGAFPTDLTFSGIDNTGMVWSTIVADFNKDGLDDLFVNYLPEGGYRILTFENVDSTNFTAQMDATAEEMGLFLVDATAGDFDGDGQLEIAGVQDNDGSVQLVVLELTYDVDGNVTGFMPPILIDNSFINMEFGIEPGKTIGITSGDFDPLDPFVDELVIAATLNTELSEVAATMVAFQLNLADSCTPGTTCANGDACTCITNLTQNRVDVLTPDIGITRPSTPIRLKTKKILAGPDMAVLGINAPLFNFTPMGGSFQGITFIHISVLDFPCTAPNAPVGTCSGETPNPLDFNLISHQEFVNDATLNEVACLHDVALGNFDPDGDKNPDLMVAALIADSDFIECSNAVVLGGGGSGSNPRVAFFEIGTTELTQTSVVNITDITAGFELPIVDNVTSYMNLEAGDLQGRSLLLGDPTKVVVKNHLQPAVVIKSPPMHVTTLAPPLGTDNNVNPSDNTVIGNIITAFPSLFNAEYGIDSTMEETFNQKNTTSYTISTQEGTEAKVSYGVPDSSGVSAKLSETTEQVHDNAVSQKFNKYTLAMNDQSLEQRFEDSMFSVQNRLNVWSYPVIGPNGQECVLCSNASNCPGIGGCSAGEAPVIVNISAPDMITVAAGSTVNLEWYQPPEVPGNVLTYPWTFAQLEQQFPGLLPLSDQTPEIEQTGTSNLPLEVMWTVENSNTMSYDSSVQHSFDTSLSVSANSEIFPGFGVDVGADFDYNSSNSFSTLFESENSSSQTQGFTINKNSIPNANAVEYPFRYYIFGQTVTLGTEQSVPQTPNNFPVTGPLYLGFEANTASASEQNPVGPWWATTYQTSSPDIALNLPAQWDWITNEGVPDDPKQFRFLKQSDTSGLFYFMKSFFAVPTDGTEGTCPSSVPGSGVFDLGPQQTVFADGDNVLLCLRVYNLSLSDFPAGSQPKVRVYRREWDYNTGAFAAESDSILVDEINLPQIPKAGAPDFGNQNSSDAPNWVYAGTVLDTSGISSEGDTYWKFWAVTWIETSEGSLLNELSDLGLSSLPRPDLGAHTSVSAEPFSNNVGLYNQVYKITEDNDFDENPELSTAQSADLSARGVGDPISILSLNAGPLDVIPGDRTGLDLIINNSDLYPHNVLLLYYDSDPDLGGQLFDMEFLPQVPAEDTFRVKNSYLPRSCGLHSLFVLMFADDGSSDIAVANVARECTAVSITEAVYTPSITQLLVSGTAQGVLRGSDLELSNANAVDNPISVLSEEDLGIKNGLRTFKFTLNNLSPDQVPCIVRVTSGQTIDQLRVLGVPENCVNDPNFPPVPQPPTPTPTPQPGPDPSPSPGGGPFDPNDDNVVDVEGVVIVSPEGTMLEDASQVQPQCPDELNGELLDYPLDFFTFEVSNINPGESIQVNFILPEGTQDIDTFFKFGPTPDNPVPHCYEFLFDGVTGAQFLSDGQILVTFVDGERGDSDLSANGVIDDPGGPAVFREADNPQIGVGDCSLARTSQPTSALISLMIPLLAGLFAGARILRRKHNKIDFN
ncbi:MAG: hypothetical protein DHS20C13_02220 [Thermodesulfobacteriota bacterium]|nr:MAG: hypothetical protein DHS20C13_02220 [Thermodesulfobacteriota bacterium]